MTGACTEEVVCVYTVGPSWDSTSTNPASAFQMMVWYGIVEFNVALDTV